MNKLWQTSVVFPVIVVTAMLAGSGIAVAADMPTGPAMAGFPMNDQVRTEVRAIRNIALAPDGRKVAAMITDTTANGGQAHLWLLAPNAAPRQLTFGRESTDEANAQWSADGGAIFFVARNDGAKSVFRMPLEGGEPVRLNLSVSGAAVGGVWGGEKPQASLSVAGFALSPDGKHMAVWAADPESPGLKARRDRKDDSYLHSVDKDTTHLYMVDPETGAASRIRLDGKFKDAAWSFDSADLIVTTDPASDEVGPDAAFWRVSRDGVSTKLDLPKTASSAAYLPGRTRLVYMDQCVDDAPPRCNDLFVKDLTGGQARNLTRGFDGAIPDHYTVDRNGDLLMTIPVHTKERLARISTKDGAVTWFDADLPVVSAAATNAGQTGWAMIASGPEQPAAVFEAAKLGGVPVKLATPAIAPAAWPKIPSKLITWQNEGLTIEGLLYMPKLPAGKRAPLIVVVHGGPAGRFADNYSNLVQMLAAEGWAVFETNPRGSTGYGQKFLAANKNDLGGADYRDIMTGTDLVLRDYPIDPDRTALIGYSYGGEMAGFVEGRTNRFKAIVAGAPVINQFSEYGTEHGSFYDQWYYGKPYEHFADAWRQSPLSTVGAAKTPFFMVQGEADSTDPLGQSVEMWRALRQMKAPVALMVYPREDHGALGQNFAANVSNEPWHGVDVRRRMFGFLRAAFAGESDPLAKAREDVQRTEALTD